MSKINSINNKTSELTIDPGASGDSFVQFDINGTGEFRVGVDDDASDAFKISAGSALGTSDVFVMASNGQRTMPLQPCFLSTVDNIKTSVTGDGTVYTMPWDEIFDQGSNFDGTSTFTAPQAGLYRLCAGVMPSGLSSSHTSMYLEIVTPNRTYRSYIVNPYNIGTPSGSTYQGSMYMNVLADMDASDTAIVRVAISGGAKTADIGYTLRGIFCGSLVC